MLYLQSAYMHGRSARLASAWPGSSQDGEVRISGRSPRLALLGEGGALTPWGEHCRGASTLQEKDPVQGSSLLL